MLPELPCEEVAHRAGFVVSVGNWITPDGLLINGENYETHHWETIKAHFGYEPDTDNHLKWMNQRVLDGFIRLVFRDDVLFQVGCESKEDIWGDSLNIKKMRHILEKILDIEIHIFSKRFYVIGYSKDILDSNFEKLQIQEIK